MRKQICYTCSKPMHPFRKSIFCSYSCYIKDKKLMALGNYNWKVRVVDIDWLLGDKNDSNKRLEK
jgi:hypothetical protein